MFFSYVFVVGITFKFIYCQLFDYKKLNFTNADNWQTAHYERNNAAGYDKGFHKYEFIWNQEGIKFFIDGAQIGFAAVDQGFWKRGGFSGNNIWAQGTRMAPFDQEVSELNYLQNYYFFS